MVSRCLYIKKPPPPVLFKLFCEGMGCISVSFVEYKIKLKSSLFSNTMTQKGIPVQTWTCIHTRHQYTHTVYPKKCAHGFVVLCFVVVIQSFIFNSHEVFIHIHQGCFAGTGAIARLPQCQWSKPNGYGKISQYITTTKHSKAKTVCIFLGIYCICIYIRTYNT